MKPDLTDCLRRLKMETCWLQNEFIAAAPHKDQRSSQLACEMAVIRLHDSWTRFCREIVVISALGRTLTLGGTSILPASGVTDRASFVRVLRSKYPYSRRWYEPKWGTAYHCIDAASRLRIGNLSTIAAALGAINSPADKIRHVRNFYAHRRRESARKATSTGLFLSSLSPTVFDLASHTVGGTTVIESWVL